MIAKYVNAARTKDRGFLRLRRGNRDGRQQRCGSALEVIHNLFHLRQTEQREENRKHGAGRIGEGVGLLY